ncbi:hypothetical protein DRN97_00165 [Methanosarcinales archaeon]|nr:MAG: hypothetical protein DRN97_00165 [Methanosarcinales archaeon]
MKSARVYPCAALLSRGDLRDVQYAAPTTTPIPRKFSLRDSQSHVIDQDGMPICVACAICAIAESRPFFDGVDLSECWVYERRANAGRGMELRDALKIMKKQGTCVNACFPISNKCLQKVCSPTRMNKEAEQYRIGSYHRVYYDLPGTIFANKLPVFAAVPVYDASWRSNGKIKMPSGKFLGYHAIVITGYDLDNKVFEFKNSWGDDWGDDGYGTLPLSYPIPEAWIVKPKEHEPQPEPEKAVTITSYKVVKSFFGARLILNIESSQEFKMSVQPSVFPFPRYIHKGSNTVAVYVPYKLNHVTHLMLMFKSRSGAEIIFVRLFEVTAKLS